MTRRIASDTLFLDEAEIARRLNKGALEWRGCATVLEREGLPKVDPFMGGRYWPAVRAFFDRRYGLTAVTAISPDGTENLDAL